MGIFFSTVQASLISLEVYRSLCCDLSLELTKKYTLYSISVNMFANLTESKLHGYSPLYCGQSLDSTDFIFLLSSKKIVSFTKRKSEMRISEFDVAAVKQSAVSVI